MIRIRQLDQIPAELAGSAVTIGNFDGVHRGHARIIDLVREMAGRLGGPSVVFTFNPPPAALLRPERLPPPLTWLDRKAELLAELGVDVLVEYPTDRALLELEAHAFFDQIVCRELRARGMVEGPNFHFGRGRGGNVARLAEWCAERDMQLEVAEPLREEEEMISSSRVRQLVQAGDVAQARRLLTRPYRCRGTVVRGASRGATIGFPTANLVGMETLLPAPGVYAGRVIGTDFTRAAAIHLGPIPTFQVTQTVLEVHVLDFSGDLYGQTLDVELLERIRDVRTFPGIEALRTQLQRDVERARELAASVLASETGGGTRSWIDVPINETLSSKPALLQMFAERLRFPDYFRPNWDSWEECLRDLSWLPSDTGIRVIQSGSPLGEATDNDRRILHEILMSHAMGNRRFMYDLR